MFIRLVSYIVRLRYCVDVVSQRDSMYSYVHSVYSSDHRNILFLKITLTAIKVVLPRDSASYGLVMTTNYDHQSPARRGEMNPGHGVGCCINKIPEHTSTVLLVGVRLRDTVHLGTVLTLM